MGGNWHLRDIVDYELTATFALLETAADRRQTLLQNIYDINANTIALGKKGELGFGDKQKSFAAIIPVEGQQDQNEVIKLVEKLEMGGVNVLRATKAFSQDGENYSVGAYVIPFDQVFARYAKDILEMQTYPEVRRAPNAPPEAPVRRVGVVAGHAVRSKSGLRKDRALKRFDTRKREGDAIVGSRRIQRAAWMEFPVYRRGSSRGG